MPIINDLFDETPSNHVLIEFEETHQLDAIVNLLKSNGFDPQSIRYTTANHEGFIITQLLAAATWDDESGYNDCQQPCTHQRTHLPWKDLSTRQRQIFMKRYSQFLINCTTDELQLNLLLDGSGTFHDVGLTSDPWGDQPEDDATEAEPPEEELETPPAIDRAPAAG